MMASSSDTTDTQDGSQTTGLAKLHLTSQEPAHSLEAMFARLSMKNGFEAQENFFDLSHEDADNASRFVQFCYLSRYDTVDRAQHSRSDQVLTKDKDGIIQYIGAAAAKIRLGLPVRDESQVHVKEVQDSAKTINAKRLEVDVNMWRMGDIYDVQHLKSYAATQFNTRLLALREHGGSPAIVLDIIGPVYECTAGSHDNLRTILVQALGKFKGAIGKDPALKSRLHMLARSNSELMTDLMDEWLVA